MGRKASVLCRQEWITEPWQYVEKEVEQRILDHGLTLGSLLERTDNLPRGSSGSGDAATILQDCSSVYDGVRKLDQLHGWRSSCETFERNSSCGPFDRMSQDPHTRVIGTRMKLGIMASAIQLAVCATGCEILRRIGHAPNGATAPRHISLDSAFQTDENWLDQRRLNLARTIVQSAATALRPEMGVTVSTKLAFPLRMAVEQFTFSDPDSVRCRTLLSQLQGDERHFATALNRNQSVASQIASHKAELTYQS